MKKLLAIFTLIAFFSVTVYAAGPISFGGSGSGDLVSTNNLSDVASAAVSRTNLGVAIGTNVQAYDADLTTYAGITPSANVQALLGAASYAAMKTLMDLEIGTDVQAYSSILGSIAAAATSANKIYGINSSGTIGLYGNIQQDDSAAQIVDAGDSSKMILLDPAGTGTTTIQSNMTATGTFSIPSDFTSADGAVGKTSSQTLTNKILTAPYIQGYEFVASTTQTLNATQAYGGRVNNYGQATAATISLPTVAYGMDIVFCMGTATSATYAISATPALLYYSGATSANAYITSPAVGDYFVVYSFKTGSSTWGWILKNGQGTIATS